MNTYNKEIVEVKKVTIMIPTYNQPQYIEQCINSAMAQDYPNLEIVISDDSTNDETERIIQDKYLHDPRINYFRNATRLGRVGNYHHTLFEKATGDYALNLDGDDYFTDFTYITRAAKILDANPDVICTIARIVSFYEEKNKYEHGGDFKMLTSIDDGNKYLLLVAEGKVGFNHMTVLYRRAEALEHNFYSINSTWTDSESIYRLVCGQKIGFFDQNVGVWRIHSTNESKKFYDAINIDEIFSFSEGIYDYCSKKDPRNNNLHIKRLNIAKYNISKNYIIRFLKEKNADKLQELFLFLLQKHTFFFLASSPKILFQLSTKFFQLRK